MTVKNKTPGVRFTTKNGEYFYVDVLWAMIIGSRKKLDVLLELNKTELDQNLCKLSLHPLMIRYYSLANYFMSDKREQQRSRVIDWYYHSLSPKIVPWQLDHPVCNKILARCADVLSRILKFLLRIPNLSPEEVFRVKNKLIGYKSIHYQGMSNKNIKMFLEKYFEITEKAN